MRTLLSKSFFQVFISTVIVLIASGPIFFYIMEKSYTDDLDEVIKYRTYQFKQEQIPLLSHIELNTWNKYNPDVQLLEFSDTITVNKPYTKLYYNEDKGVELSYRTINSLIYIDNKIHILSIRVPMIEQRDFIKNITLQHLLLVLFILITLLWLHQANANKLWKPFYDSLNLLNNFNIQHNKLPQFTPSSTIEFNQLNSNLKKLMNRVLESYNTQKQFIENASHELQTPIAIFRSQLDLLLQSENLTAEQTDIIQSLYATSISVGKLNKNLLLLAKIDNGQFDEEQIELAPLIEEYNNRFLELANIHNINLHITTTPVTINANRSLLEVAISNLLSNAIRYNKDGGDVYTQLTADTISISNSSIGGELDRDCIFKRFQKSKCCKKGNGLGLAIVKQICGYNRWTILYDFHKGIHTFSIIFK